MDQFKEAETFFETVKAVVAKIFKVTHRTTLGKIVLLPSDYKKLRIKDLERQLDKQQSEIIALCKLNTKLASIINKMREKEQN